MIALRRREDATPATFRRWLDDSLAEQLLALDGCTGLALHTPMDSAPAPAADAVASLRLSAVGDAALPAALPGLAEAAAAQVDGLDAWRVDEHVRLPYARDWPDGEPSPGLAMVSFMHEAPGIAREDCVAHWTERHTPLALRVHVGLWRYVQNVVVETLTPGGGGVFGVAELHFRSEDDFRERMFDSPGGRVEIFEDIPNFMSLEASTSILARERIVKSDARE